MKRVFRARALLVAVLFFLGSGSFASNKRYVLFVGTYTKGASKGIYAYRYQAASGQLTSLGLAAEAVNPSFLTVDPSRKFLYSVNEVQDYKGEASGAVTAFAIDRKSAKLSRLNEVASRGADPGLDRVLIYKFDATTGKLAFGESATAKVKAASLDTKGYFSATLAPGTGPRHVAFSADGDFMYVLGELDSTVTVFANDAKETFRSIQKIPALPAG